MKPNIDYASEIKSLLTEKGLNQKELAQELGTTYINVNKTLNGHTMTARNRDRPPPSPQGNPTPPRQAEQDKGDTGGGMKPRRPKGSRAIARTKWQFNELYEL